MKSSQLSALILAGGQGRRLGGTDKGLALYQNTPLIEHITTNIGASCDQIVISCNRNIDQYERYADLCVKDDLVDYQGPLSGINSAIHMCKHDLIFICPCDAPNINAQVLNSLLTTLEKSQSELVVAHDTHRLQNLVMLGKKSVFMSISTFLNNQQRAVGKWIQQQAHIICYFDDNTLFRNLNDNKDFTHD